MIKLFGQINVVANCNADPAMLTRFLSAVFLFFCFLMYRHLIKNFISDCADLHSLIKVPGSEFGIALGIASPRIKKPGGIIQDDAQIGN